MVCKSTSVMKSREMSGPTENNYTIFNIDNNHHLSIWVNSTVHSTNNNNQ